MMQFMPHMFGQQSGMGGQPQPGGMPQQGQQGGIAPMIMQMIQKRRAMHPTPNLQQMDQQGNAGEFGGEAAQLGRQSMQPGGAYGGGGRDRFNPQEMMMF